MRSYNDVLELPHIQCYDNVIKHTSKKVLPFGCARTCMKNS